MKDVVVDTNILADLIAQFYASEFGSESLIQSSKILTDACVRRINSIIRWHADSWITEDNGTPGLVIASTFAFIEISRKFNEISQDRFTISQFQAFISQPPKWFFIAACDYALLEHLERLPPYVTLPSGNNEPVELADAIHAATALSRDHAYLTTTDIRLQSVDILKPNIL